MPLAKSATAELMEEQVVLFVTVCDGGASDRGGAIATVLAGCSALTIRGERSPLFFGGVVVLDVGINVMGTVAVGMVANKAGEGVAANKAGGAPTILAIRRPHTKSAMDVANASAIDVVVGLSIAVLFVWEVREVITGGGGAGGFAAVVPVAFIW